jgi:hypothetical protein
VLAVVADQPELHPGDTTNLHALVTDPTRPGKNNTLIWIGCDPDPLDLGRSACADFGNLQNGAALASVIDGGTIVLPEGMHEIGYDDSAAYQAPADTFAQIPVGDPRRLRGSVADLIIVALGGDLPLTATDAERQAFFTAAENNQIGTRLVIDRLVISEENPLNQNPVLGALTVDGTALPDGGTFRVSPGETVQVVIQAPDSSFESYTEIQPDGTTTQNTEVLTAAFFATTGNFSNDRVGLRDPSPLSFTAPAGTADDPLPDKGTGTLWVVVRDERAGETWNTYPLFVCDPTLPPPRVDSLNPVSGPANGSTSLALLGENLASILDVVVGGTALQFGAFSPVQQNFNGLVTTLPSGDYPVTLRGRDCRDYSTGLSYHVP